MAAALVGLALYARSLGAHVAPLPEHGDGSPAAPALVAPE